jgi:hypothetical protein
MAGLSDLVSGGLGIFGSLLGANQARHNEDFYRSEGDPYRSQLRAMTADPSVYFKGPIAQELARQADSRYSSQFGNPAGSGTAQALSLQAMLSGYDNERKLLGNLGGLSDINAGIVPGNNAVGKADQGVFGSLQDLLKIAGGFGGGGTPDPQAGLIS